MGKKILFIIVIFCFSSNALCMSSEVETYQTQGLKNPKWDSIVLRAFQIYETGQYEQALLPLKEAYNLGCRDGLVLYRILWIYSKALKQCDNVFTFANETIKALEKQYPKHRYYSAVFGELADCSNKVSTVIEYYNKALSIDPLDIGLRLNFAHRLIEHKELNEAENQIQLVLNKYQSYLSSNGYAVAYMNFCRIESERKNFEKAIKYCEKTLEYRPLNAYAAWDFAELYRKAGNSEKEVYYWKKAVELFGENSEWGIEAKKNIAKAKDLALQPPPGK